MNKIARKIIRLVSKNYVFPDKANCLSIVINNNIEMGKYNTMQQKKFIETINKDIHQVLKDSHVKVSYIKKKPKGKRTPCFRGVSILKHNIGYFRFDCFKLLENSKGNFIAGMKLLENTNAIIFDLRFNGGGYPVTVNFIQSFLFERRTLLNITCFRDPKGKMHTYKFYTLTKKELDKEFTKGKNSRKKYNLDYKRFYKIPIVVLISSKTFSAAEEFAYNLQNKKRGVIIGETSGGGANGGRKYNLTKTIQIFISRSESYNPISKTSWEGIGIKPDIRVKSTKSVEKAVSFLQKKYKFK